MLIYVPLPSFQESARCLDRQDLEIQTILCFEYLKEHILIEKEGKAPKSSSVRSSPSFRMWRSYRGALQFFCHLLVEEIRKYDKTQEAVRFPTDFNVPDWLGNEKLHSSHRAYLLRLNPSFYSRYEWKDSKSLPLFWPEGI